MKRLFFVCLAVALAVAVSGVAQGQGRSKKDWKKRYSRAWRDIARLMNTDPKKLNPRDLYMRIDRLVDLYSDIHNSVSEKKISSRGRYLAKQGIHLFLREYLHVNKMEGDAAKTALILLMNLYRNRALLTEILLSESRKEIISQRLLAYAKRKTFFQPYRNLRPITTQLRCPAGTGDIRIVKEKILLVADRGPTSSMNGAIDAGEEIEIRIALKNVGSKAWRSTSAYLESDDPNAVVVHDEVVYSTKEVRGGQTVTFGPGSVIEPTDTFRFFIRAECPHETWVKFKVKIWDSEHGVHYQYFNLQAYNVGPVVPAVDTALIDDDEPGYSDPVVEDGKIDVGETIEYLLPLRNQGTPTVRNLKATLSSDDPRIEFRPGHSVLQYREVRGQTDESIPAAFVFEVLERETASEVAYFQLHIRGDYRGHPYSWIRAYASPIKLDPEMEFNILKSVFEKAKFGGRAVRHKGAITDCVFSPAAGNHLFTCGCDGRVVYGPGVGGAGYATREEAGEWILSLSLDAGRMASGSTSGRVWLKSGYERSWKRSNWVRAVLLCEGGVLWGDEEGTIGLWNGRTSVWTASFSRAPIMDLCAGATKDTILVAAGDGRVAVVSTKDGKTARELSSAMKNDTVSSAHCADGIIAWACHSGEVWVCHPGKSPLRLAAVRGERQLALRLVRRGKALASASETGAIRIWHVETGRLLVRWSKAGNAVRALAWHEESQRFAAGDDGGGLSLWSLK